jgi:hypothetical protein
MTTLLTQAKRAGYLVAAAIVRGDGRVELQFDHGAGRPPNNAADREAHPQ